MQRGAASRSAVLKGFRACWLAGSGQPTRPLSQLCPAECHKRLLCIQSPSKTARDMLQTCSKVTSMGQRCYHPTMLHPEAEDELHLGQRLQGEEHFKLQPILATDKNVEGTTNEEESPYTSSQSLDYDELESKEQYRETREQDLEAKEQYRESKEQYRESQEQYRESKEQYMESQEQYTEEKEDQQQKPEMEPEPELPFRRQQQQQQPMGHSALKVFATTDNKEGQGQPPADSDRDQDRFKEQTSDKQQAAKDEAKESAAPRDRRAAQAPMDKFVRTDLQRHKEREYLGIYWNGKGERHDSRHDTDAEEDTGYVTGEGVPLRKPKPKPQK